MFTADLEATWPSDTVLSFRKIAKKTVFRKKNMSGIVVSEYVFRDYKSRGFNQVLQSIRISGNEDAF